MTRTTKRCLPPVLLLAVCVTLTGCAAGLALLAYEKWDDWFKKENASDYRIYLDGYDYGGTPSASGIISLSGVSEGDYLITVAKPPEMRMGVHATMHVQPFRSVDLSQTNPFQGGVITGTVRRDGPAGPVVANVRVVAILDAANILSRSSTPISIPQSAGTTLEYMMGYTDSQGKFRLGPARYGAWLVTAVLAGYNADVKFTRVASGSDGQAQLVLTPATGTDTGIIRGTVTTQGGSGANKPLVTARLGTAFEPTIDSSTRSRVEADARVTMPTGPWFRWLTLTTIATDSGQYVLDVPPGTHTVEAARYPARSAQREVTVPAGGIATQDLTLSGG